MACHRRQPHCASWLRLAYIHKGCHLIERFFNKIEHDRRVFPWFEKLAKIAWALPRLVSALILATVKCQQNLKLSLEKFRPSLT